MARIKKHINTNTTAPRTHGWGHKAAIYARFSTENQDATTIDAQVNKCLERVKEHAKEVYEVYTDYAVSGTHTDRPGLKKLREDAKAGLFSYVYVNDSSRLSRHARDFGNIVFDEFTPLGIVLIECHQNTRSDGPDAEFIATIMGALNQKQIQVISYQTHTKLADLHRQNSWTGGTAYGYKIVPVDPSRPDKQQKLVFDETQSNTIRLIAQKWLETGSVDAVVAHLNANNVPPPRRKSGWLPATVRCILRCERYVGVFKWNTHKWIRPDRNSKKKLPVERPESEHMVSNVPELAIFDKDTWQVIQDRFPKDGKRGPYKKRNTETVAAA